METIPTGPKMPAPRSGSGLRNGMADRPRGLIDTGAILALLDESDSWHRRCSDIYRTLRLPLATSAAVLTELFHLLGGPHQAAKAWGFLRSGAVTVLPIGDGDLSDLEALMVRYSDRPMDYTFEETECEK